MPGGNSMIVRIIQPIGLLNYLKVIFWQKPVYMHVWRKVNFSTYYLIFVVYLNPLCWFPYYFKVLYINDTVNYINDEAVN